MKKRILLCCATSLLLASLGACSSGSEGDISSTSSDSSSSDSSTNSSVEETVEVVDRETIYVKQDGYTIEMPTDLTHLSLREFARETDWGYSPIINMVTVAYDEEEISNLLLQLETDLEGYAEQNGYDKEELLAEDISVEYTDWTTANGLDFAYLSVCYSKAIPDVPDPWNYLLFLVQDDLCFWIDTTLHNPEAIPEMENYILSIFDTMVVGPDGVILYEISEPEFFYQDENNEPVFITQAQANGIEEIA